jgi:hypothetical protein
MADSIGTSAYRGGRFTDVLLKALGGLAVIVDVVLSVLVTKSGSSGFGAVIMFVILMLVFGLVLAAGIVGLEHLLTLPVYRQVRNPSGSSQASSAEPAWVPLQQWRGMAATTQAVSVQASCGRCNRAWRLEREAANRIAGAQNLGKRMKRTGTKLEQTGATFTLGASGRRIAAGLESERLQRDLASALALAACPSCGKVDRVSLRK